MSYELHQLLKWVQFIVLYLRNCPFQLLPISDELRPFCYTRAVCNKIPFLQIPDS